MLKNSKYTLLKLYEYLRAHGILDEDFPLPGLVHDPEQDQRNLIDPRVFCYCTRGEPHIFTTRELEYVPLKFRIGILLHEIGHLALQAFDGDASEVDVDTWVLTNLPDAGYQYDDCLYQRDLARPGVAPVKAENLEVVSPSFSRAVMMIDYSQDI